MGVADGAVAEFRQASHQFGPPSYRGRGGAAAGRRQQGTCPVGAAGEQGLFGGGRVPLGPGRRGGRQFGGAGVRRAAQPVGGRLRSVGGGRRQPVREPYRRPRAGQ
ncbi:hypothetical protein [Streptomyces sp. AC602_WCS936]|uniref:hypothetical protein n=1 Tax=Streptomyces sp. AC602_WCS936 TaxID=2823685 RepID=UPI0035B4115D